LGDTHRSLARSGSAPASSNQSSTAYRRGLALLESLDARGSLDSEQRRLADDIRARLEGDAKL